MRYCQARMGIRSPRRGADKGYTAGTSVDVSVSTGFVFTSPESAASAPRLGQPAQAAHGSSPEPRFHIKVEEIFGWMKMIGPPIRTGSPVRSARIRQVIWSAQRTI